MSSLWSWPSTNLLTSSRMCWPKSTTFTTGRAKLRFEPLQAVELALAVHGFAEAVGEDREYVARLDLVLDTIRIRILRRHPAAGPPLLRRFRMTLPSRRRRIGAMWPALTHR